MFQIDSMSKVSRNGVEADSDGVVVLAGVVVKVVMIVMIKGKIHTATIHCA